MKKNDYISIFISTVILFGYLSQLALSAGENKLIISDNFERNYNDSNESTSSYGCLGTTKEGYKWHRRDINKNGADLHGPGILTYEENNKGMIWKNPSRTSDIVFLANPATKVKDFKLTFDYYRKGGLTQHGGIINFRMSNAGGAITDGGIGIGYALLFYPASKKSVKVKLFSDHGFSKSSSEILWEGSTTIQITLIAKANNFKVYIGATQAFDVIDETDNPAKSQSGFFTIQFNKWRPEEHGFDNWKVWRNHEQ